MIGHEEKNDTLVLRKQIRQSRYLGGPDTVVLTRDMDHSLKPASAWHVHAMVRVGVEVNRRECPSAEEFLHFAETTKQVK